MGFIILVIDVKPLGSAALERDLEKKIDCKTSNQVFYLIQTGLFASADSIHMKTVKSARQARPLIEIMKQPDALLSTVTSTCGYIGFLSLFFFSDSIIAS